MIRQTITESQIKEPIPVIGGGAVFAEKISWSQWLATVVTSNQFRKTLDFPDTANNATSPLVIEVKGAKALDAVLVTVHPDLVLAGTRYWGAVTAVDEVTIFFENR